MSVFNNATNVTATAHSNAALISSLGAVGTPTAATGSDSYTPLSAESILFFCQKQMRDMDAKIQGAMKDQQNQVGLQDAISAVQTALKLSTNGGNDTVAFNDDQAAMNNANAKLNNAIELAKQANQPDLVKTLQDVSKTLNQGVGDTKDLCVTKDELKSMNDTLDSSLSGLRSGAEMSMISLQALVSKRSTQLQLTTGMMNAINEGMKSVAANVGR